MKSAMWCVLCAAVYLNSAMFVVAEEKAVAQNDEVVEILKQWEAASKEIKFLDVSLKVYNYNQVFRTESRGVGRFVWEGPNRGLLSIQPAKIAADDVSQKKDRNGTRYQLSPGDASAWYWDGLSVTHINENAKTYESIALPETELEMGSKYPDSKSWWPELQLLILRLFRGPQGVCPMVVDIQAERLLKGYHWSIQKPGNHKSGTIVLLASPKNEQLRQEYREIRISLDAKTFRTIATKRTDPNGHIETVCIFGKPRTEPHKSWIPKLKEYKQVGNPSLTSSK